MREIVLGRCNDCSMDDKNSGYFGQYMSIDNCVDSKCDIYINIFDKRHECIGSTSITDCLYTNPTKIKYYDRNGTKTVREYSTPSEISYAMSKYQNIQQDEVMSMINRMMRPCGGNLSDFATSDSMGCFPYSDSVFSSGNMCPNGEKTMYSKNCRDVGCGVLEIDGTGNRVNNPCSVRIKYLDTDMVWKSDMCSYLCPSYMTQRFYLQITGSTDESDICSSEYSELCRMSGCEVDTACRIKWGGCSLVDLDSDICNGITWFNNIEKKEYKNENMCKKDYCKNKCGNGVGRRCNNFGMVRGLLPTVVNVEYFGKTMEIMSKEIYNRKGEWYKLHNDSGNVGFIINSDANTVFMLKKVEYNICEIVSNNEVVKVDIKTMGMSTKYGNDLPHRWVVEDMGVMEVRFVLIDDGGRRLGYLMPNVENIWKNGGGREYYCRAILSQLPNERCLMVLKYV